METTNEVSFSQKPMYDADGALMFWKNVLKRKI